MFTDRILDILDDVAASFANSIDSFTTTRSRTGDQLIDRASENLQPCLDFVDHFGAGIGGESFDLFGELRKIIAQTLQVLLQVFDVV
jgi:hypothetical protein